VAGNVDQARDLLGSANTFVVTGQEHIQNDDRAAAVAAGRAAEEAIGQADALLTFVSQARTELAEAAGRIDAALASISSDVADADRLGANDQLTPHRSGRGPCCHRRGTGGTRRRGSAGRAQGPDAR
jgi:hypothetical protein